MDSFLFHRHLVETNKTTTLAQQEALSLPTDQHIYPSGYVQTNSYLRSIFFPLQGGRASLATSTVGHYTQFAFSVFFSSNEPNSLLITFRA